MAVVVIAGGGGTGARSRTVTVANGVQTTFPVSFPLPPRQGRAGVNVYVHSGTDAHPGTPKTLGVDYSWVSDGQISMLTGAPASGQQVDIRRVTQDTALDNSLQAGGSLKSSELVQNDTQLLYLIQEREDMDDDLQAQLDGEVSVRTANDTTLFTQIASILASIGAGPISLNALPLIAASMAALGALDTSLSLPALYIENGKTGVFTVQAYDAAKVAADPRNIVYKQSASDPTKMWVRQYEGRLNVQWAGALLDNTANDGAAVKATTDLADALYYSNPAIGYGHGGAMSVYIPFGIAYMGNTALAPANSMRIVGNNANGLEGSAAISGMRWAAGTTGVTISNSGVAFDGIHFIGTFGGVEGEFHGILAKRPFYFTRCAFINWQGDGINYDSSAGFNVNNASGSLSWFQNCRNGIWNKAGSDNSAMAWSQLNFFGCREWSFKDESFLANSHAAYHADSSSLTGYNDGVSIGCAITVSAGNRYFAIKGQEVWCSTNAPSGTTADNQGWAYLQAGGAAPGIGIIAWFNGILVRAGGSFYSSTINVPSTWSGCYTEGGQALAQICTPAVIIGGALAQTGLWKGKLGSFIAANCITGHSGATESNQPFQHFPREVTDETFTASLGAGDGSKALLAWVGSVTGLLGWQFRAGVDMYWSYAGVGASSAPYKITGPTSTEQGGSGVNLGYGYLMSTRFLVGENYAGCRKITNGAGAPPAAGTWAQGDYCRNRAPAVGQPKGWLCTVSGTPGTWVSEGNL